MLLVKTRVAPSAIHGLGLFAAEPIKAGTRIARFVHGMDCIIRLGSHVVVLFEEFARKYGYHDKDDGFWKIPLDDLRYMNHADTPNTRQEGDSDFAARDIAAGEEITGDYFAFDMDAARKLGR